MKNHQNRDFPGFFHAALTSTRSKETAAQIDARALKDENDTWDKWVFEEVEMEDGEFFAGKIKRIDIDDDDGETILVFVEIKKSINTKEQSILLDDFMEDLEGGVYEWLGNDGAAGREAIRRYKAWLDEGR